MPKESNTLMSVIERSRSPVEPNPERQARIIEAVHQTASEGRPPVVVIQGQLRRFAPTLAAAAAVAILGVWLFNSPPEDEVKPLAMPFLNMALPGKLEEATNASYEAELKHLQRDLFRTALFVGDAVESRKINIDGRDKDDQ